MTLTSRFTGRHRCRTAMAAAAALIMAACSTSGDSPATVRTVAPADCPVTGEPARDHVVLWHPFAGEPARAALTTVLDRFRAAHPDLPVLVEAVTPDSPAARLAHTAPGEGPDLVIVPDADLTRLADSGRTVPAGDCLDQSGGPPADRFLPAVRAAWTRRGRLWAVPYGATIPLLWYNTQRLAAAGGTVPETREQLAATLRAVHRRTGRPALRYDLELAYLLVQRWSAQRGRPLVDVDGDGRTRVHLDRPEVRADLLWLRDLDGEGVAATNRGDSDPEDVLALNDPADHAALAVQSSASLADARRAMDLGGLDPDLGGLAPLPGPAGPAPEPPPGGYGVVLAGGPGTDPRRAARVAAWFAQPASQADLAATGGLAPVVPGVERQPALAEVFERHPPFRLATDRVREAPAPAPATVDPAGTEGDLRMTLIDTYRGILDGEDPAAALARAQRTASRQVELYEDAHR